MRSLLGIPAVAIALWLVGANTADGSYCGALRHGCCKRACCATECTCCKVECHTVMKKVKEIVYDEEEVTCYRTVYEEVPGEKIDAIKYEEATAYRYKCCDACEENPGNGDGCGCGEAPRKCIRKVPYTTFVEVKFQKEGKPRIVEKKVPYTIICCTPRVVYKEVPVEVCCPVPCCCKPKCCCKS